MLLKQQAMSELYRKAGIRPMLGCLPVLLQMPVWISLYQALGTAVELYHTPFGPLIPDLTHADPYHVIPIVLGGSSFLQQKLMPAQGVDPAQQKMMLYLFPLIFAISGVNFPIGVLNYSGPPCQRPS
jgi:YidC/Oxa1 family membrane protein insertase